MASIILSTAGSFAGSSTGIPGANIIGSQIGRMAGNFIDERVFGRGGLQLRDREGPRLADLAVQTSTYGKMIPIVYGTVRIAGNIIWSRPIRETASTSTSSAGSGGKGGGGRVTQTSTTYSYSVSLAVAVCEGEVDEIFRIWADAKQLDLSQLTLRIYRGDETQTPDTYIQSFEGAGRTPAYRGLAYVVIEDFPLGDFGNRIPNFTFEVRKKAQYPDYEGEVLEEMITGMTLIPGAGEYVYDTQVQYKVPGGQVGADWVQQGNSAAINMHNPTGSANVQLALDQLERTCPNVGWVSVVVTWFGDSLDAGDCVVKPGVEYQDGATTSPDIWGVGAFTRATARQITMVDGSPRYGGTPDDSSVLRLLDELNARGYNIMFYPMLFMDVDGKPWRGELTGSATDVADFFTKTNGFNAFITHYASLVADKVDAFVIGSEMKGLTKVTDTPGSYPAVDELVALAATVKSIVGGVQVTYAADWSEYHHTDGGWYNLDPLWASDDIDMIGIDAYFPLSDQPQNGYDVQELIDGWTQGEGYDWYYSDPERSVQAPLSPEYAWKNLQWFWENTHTNPDASATAWVPESKKIWFTEFGFPSVDGAGNQPNVFYDPASGASGFPYHSRGRVDFRAQRAGLTATEAKWQGSEMVERMFIWTWDARPYPFWPDLTNVWADGGNWKYGHWVNGKLGVSSLAAIVADLCQRAGLEETDFGVSSITDQVEGFVLSSQQTVRAAVESLMKAYFFDASESGDVLRFIPRGGSAAVGIEEDKLVPLEDARVLAITRAQEIELPRRVNVLYLNRLGNYQPATQYAERMVTESRQVITADLPLVFSDQAAKVIADVTLYSGWAGRNSYRFSLPLQYARIEPADVITVTASGVEHCIRVTATKLMAPGVLHVDAIGEEQGAYDFYTAPGDTPTGTASADPVAETVLEFLDIAALPGDAVERGTLRLAAAGDAANWNGAVVYRSEDAGGSYERLLDLTTAAVLGAAVTVLPAGPYAVFDDVSTVTISLLGDAELASTGEIAVLNGANIAVIGAEILQFKTATLVEPGKYTLSGLLRGRMGTEWAIGSHAAGERFVLLNARVGRQAMPNALLGLARLYKPVSVGRTLTETGALSHTYTGVSLKPYAPVHASGTRDGSDNLTIEWVRRTRVSGSWLDAVDVPLNEESEAYEVEIMDGADVVRTLTGLSSPTASYSAADQITDFGSEQSSVAVKIYQLSAVVGRGYAGEASV